MGAQPVPFNSCWALLWLLLGVSGWILQTSCLWGSLHIGSHWAVQNAKHFSYGNVLCVVLINAPPSLAVFLDSFHLLLLLVAFFLGPGPPPLAHLELFSR